ncbi:hypothetical protein MMC19_002707 [Ptychographa xylographoides]|nr:hypothetical protein [Ptychographa xylographoides]
MLNRRFLILLLTAAAILCFTYLGLFRSNHSSASYSKTPIHHVTVADSTLKGDAIMGKIGNETLKAELGRASWKLFHTTMARFPDKPTEDEQTALFSYIHLFARLYPCGECAGHFRTILNKFPPQVRTRSTAAAWACHVHNEVNKSLKKPLFDCSNIGDFYDCGCAEEPGEKDGESGKKVVSARSITGERGSSKKREALIKGVTATSHEEPELKLEREG